VPPYRAGIAATGSLGGSTAEKSDEIYIESIINPRQATIEPLINKHIIWDGLQCYDWRFKLVEIDTSDEEHDLDVIERLWLMGAMTINEVIRVLGGRFGLKEVKHALMDAHWIAGRPIDVDEEYDPELIAAVKAFQTDLHKMLKEEREERRAAAKAREQLDRDLEDAGSLRSDKVSA
jgi:hypothetical protein